MSAYSMPSAMFNTFLDTETDSEGQSSSPLSHGWHLTQPNNCSYACPMSSPLISRARSTLAPFPDAISILTPTPEYLSTGAPRLVPVWKRCCQCKNLTNPHLAPEKCSICSHVPCPDCSDENVPA
ncbi:uncharacterized protein N7500_007043 [Penicillium coprophilum]|uniref:uncharacterized protein n=1 Tax=Penicillium coprophilum TaxID=36646 RepID=UPI0023976CCE|nr:uncharacterized protein N7500_007043 [Penicillium coprophilum]KAJ5165213.1 hypothetical protein N7500_007043 [Penicillium coprophilum]